MARTFDALEKAEKQKEQAGVDVTRMAESPPVIKRKAPLGPEASARMTEEFTRLRQSIVAALPELKTRALLFTSSTAGEGSRNDDRLGACFYRLVLDFASGRLRTFVYANGYIFCTTPDCWGCSMGRKDRHSDIDIEEILSEKQ